MSLLSPNRSMTSAPRADRSRAPHIVRPGEELALALVITAAAAVLPRWRVLEQAWVHDFAGLRALSWAWYVSIVLVLFGLLLCLTAPHRSGLRLGALRDHWKGVLVVCGGTILVTALVYPRLPVRPWGDAPALMWTMSPLAQQLVFMGYLYGRLEAAFPGYLHPRLPVARALVLTTGFFALWHIDNFFTIPAGYVLFQLFYTGILAIIPGLARQWTGSILYTLLTHVAVNWIAWSAS